jgi:hypothetical protein
MDETMVRALVFIGCMTSLGCIPDVSELEKGLGACPEVVPWSEDQWSELESGDAHEIHQPLWAQQAICLVTRTALLAKDLAAAEAPDDATVNRFALEAADTAEHLLRFQTQKWLHCDCDEGCRLEAGDVEMFNPVCALGGDQVDLYRGVVEEVRAHAGYAAGEPGAKGRRSHAEHVMQCLSASSPPTDWDLDGTVAPPALCSNDYGLYGGGVGNLLEAIVTQTAAITP